MDKIIDELKNKSYTIDDKEKTLVKNYEFNKDIYKIGITINKYDNNYEVYYYVINDQTNNIVSGLLYREFNNLDESSIYATKLIESLENTEIEHYLELKID